MLFHVETQNESPSHVLELSVDNLQKCRQNAKLIRNLKDRVTFFQVN